MLHEEEVVAEKRAVPEGAHPPREGRRSPTSSTVSETVRKEQIDVDDRGAGNR